MLVYLGEIDARRLWAERACSSMFVFCTKELGFSEGAAYNRITVARVGRRLPAVIEALRSGRVHLAGLRLLAPHLAEANCESLLAAAAGRTKQQIEELIAALAPKPPVAALIRKLPERAAPPALTTAPRPDAAVPTPAKAASVIPLAVDSYKVQFTASRELRDDLRAAQDLMRHRVPDGELATIVHAAVKLLIAQLEKERFAIGRQPRTKAAASSSRHVPAALRRAVYERDGGRCTFTNEEGARCDATGLLELDHVDGFARTHEHAADRLRLLCRAHNQHAADQLYGRAFMDAARTGTRPGTSA